MLLDDALRDARAAYERAHPTSAALAECARAVLPGGNTRSGLHVEPFAFRVASAEGAYLTDVDGHVYLDLLGDYSAGLLGHRPAAVRAAPAPGPLADTVLLLSVPAPAPATAPPNGTCRSLRRCPRRRRPDARPAWRRRRTWESAAGNA